MLNSLSYAARMLYKNPGFTAVAVCSLAIGIGATSSMFSFADALLLRPLPVFEPSRVVAVSTVASSAFGANTSISYPDYLDLRDRNRTFGGLVAASYATFGFSRKAGNQPHMKFGLFVSGNLFQVLGVEPSLGRGFRASEDQVVGTDPVIVLGHAFWVSEFAADPSVVGSRLRLNGTEFTVVGVAPERFTGIDQYLRPALFVPLAMSPLMGSQTSLSLSHESSLTRRDIRWLMVKGRLAPGVNLSQAQSDIGTIAKRLEQMYPQTTNVSPSKPSFSFRLSRRRPILRWL
jgi:hypothetical protein